MGLLESLDIAEPRKPYSEADRKSVLWRRGRFVDSKVRRPRDMRINRRERLRQQLFQQGAAALEAARPKAPKGYACPICLLGYPSADPFSLEDVPPKSIGGRPLLLTCTSCNSKAGHELDVHIHEGVKEAEIASGKRALEARLSAFGETITANVRIENGELLITGEPSRSDPRAHERFFKEMERLSEFEATGTSFNITYNTKHDAWRESVAWLRVGYLYAFAVLGYNFILRPELEPIRAQIRSPGQRLVPQLVKRLKKPPNENGIQFVRDPVEFRSIIVVYGERIVVLPDFEHPSTFTERIMQVSGEQWPRQLVGKQLPLPRRPYFFLDFMPSLNRHISPEFQEE